MFAAIASNDMKTLENCLRHQAEAVKSVDENGSSLLHFSTSWGNLAATELLLKFGADVNALNDHGWSPLTEAVYWADHYAALKKSPESDANASACLTIADALRAKGGKQYSNPKTKSGEKRKLLMVHPSDPVNNMKKALKSDNVNAALCALASFDVDQKIDKNGSRALHHVAAEGSMNVARLLLSCRADPNCVNSRGWSPLTEAQYWSTNYAAKGQHSKAADCLRTAIVLEHYGGKQHGLPETGVSKMRQEQKAKALHSNEFSEQLADVETLRPEDSVSNFHSSASLISSVSVVVPKTDAKSEPKCFPKNTVFKLTDGTLAPVELLNPGDYVKSATGHPLLLWRKREHKGFQLIELLAGSTKLVVTPTHRILTDEGTIQAQEIREGTLVSISGGMTSEVTVAQVHEVPSGVTVFEVAFEPDEPVEVFIEPSEQILSLGSAASQCGRRTRRSGMGWRLQRKEMREIQQIKTDDGYPQ